MDSEAPSAEIIASFETLEEAKNYARHISKHRVSIREQRQVRVQSVSNPTSDVKAFVEGAYSGLLVGALFGLIPVLFDWVNGSRIWIIVITGVVAGIVAGGLLGVAGARFSGAGKSRRINRYNVVALSNSQSRTSRAG